MVLPLLTVYYFASQKVSRVSVVVSMISLEFVDEINVHKNCKQESTKVKIESMD